MTVREIRDARRNKTSQLGTNILLKGYPGLTHTAHQIAEYIPKCKVYVEPFAGLGRTAKHVTADTVILNDMSDFAIKYLKSHFDVKITHLDFVECIKQNDSRITFFLIDPPWRENIYANNEGPVLDRRPIEYYQKFFSMVPTLKGDWILCSDKDEHEIRKICSKSGYYTKVIESKRKLFNKNIGTLLTSNKPFIRHQQQDLFNYFEES